MGAVYILILFCVLLVRMDWNAVATTQMKEVFSKKEDKDDDANDVNRLGASGKAVARTDRLWDDLAEDENEGGGCGTTDDTACERRREDGNAGVDEGIAEEQSAEEQVAALAQW